VSVIFQKCRDCGRRDAIRLPGWYKVGLLEEIDNLLKDLVEDKGRCRKCGGRLKILQID
jgi:hypothetical protein